MTSYIKIKRICQLCGKDFTARTTSTKYCGDICAKRAYKARKREEKIAKSHKETVQFETQSINSIQQKEFLTVPDVAVLLGCSRRTAYRLVANGTLSAVNLADRMTRIKKSEINKVLEKPPSNEQDVLSFNISECYNISDIQDKFNISRAGAGQLIKRHNIPKVQQGKFVYVPKIMIDKLFS